MTSTSNKSSFSCSGESCEYESADEGCFNQFIRKQPQQGGGKTQNQEIEQQCSKRPKTTSAKLELIVPCVQPESLEGACLRVGYKLGRLLGTGKYGNAFSAWNIQTEQQCVLKVVHYDNAATKQVPLHEAACMEAGGSHPNVVGLRNVVELQLQGTTRTICLLELEECHPHDFCDNVMQWGKLHEQVCKYYFRQLLEAIDHLQKRGVFHSDLKPDNLLISLDFTQLKVADFGLSILTDTTTTTANKRGKRGTPAFMAPEVFGGSFYDPGAADIWSCGIVLYSLLTESLPFDAPRQDIDESFQLFSCSPEIWWLNQEAWLPNGAIKLLRRMLVVDPDFRADIGELLADQWLSRAPCAAAVVSYMTQRSAR